MAIQFGLTEKYIELLKNIFSKYDSIEEVIVYGSRAKGNYTERSDIDLAMKEKTSNRHLIGAVLLDLDDSDLPYKVDLQDYDKIKNKELKAHINRVGQLLYKRQ
ncbi:MAG: nucleotidyltransferase domain-containing protein [Spirosomataceae bacterium]